MVQINGWRNAICLKEDSKTFEFSLFSFNTKNTNQKINSLYKDNRKTTKGVNKNAFFETKQRFKFLFLRGKNKRN